MGATKKKSKKGATASNSVNVNGAADIPKLVDILKKNKTVIVLIWADYCGHCHTFKDQVWNKLSSNKNRKAGLASIHYDQLETTPASIPKKVSGYPTVLYVGENGEHQEIKNPRDLDEMTRIAESDDPESLLNGISTEVQNTPPLTKEAEALTVDVDPEEVLNSVSRNGNNVRPKSKAVAPNMRDDMLNSQNVNKPLSVEKMDSGRVGAASGGGSLYKALVGMFKQRQTRSSKGKRGKHTRRSVR